MKYKTKFEQWYNKQSVQLILDGCEISPFMKDQIVNVLTHRSPHTINGKILLIG